MTVASKDWKKCAKLYRPYDTYAKADLPGTLWTCCRCSAIVQSISFFRDMRIVLSVSFSFSLSDLSCSWCSDKMRNCGVCQFFLVCKTRAELLWAIKTITAWTLPPIFSTSSQLSELCATASTQFRQLDLACAIVCEHTAAPLYVACLKRVKTLCLENYVHLLDAIKASMMWLNIMRTLRTKSNNIQSLDVQLFVPLFERIKYW